MDNTEKTQGVMMFNKGTKMLVSALVALHSLRKHYNGNITFYIEDPTPVEFEESLKLFNCTVIRNEPRDDLRTLVIKSMLLENPPYDYTLWMDLDTVTVGKVDDMFDYLTKEDVDLCIPSFCNWVSTGNHISRRIKGFSGIMEDKYITEALKEHPAINTGVLSIRRSDKWREFMKSVNRVAIKGSEQHKFIPDEVSMQLHISSIGEWGLKYYLAPTNFNVSPLHDHGLSKDPRICHYHGSKSTFDVPLCDFFKKELAEMMESNTANINFFLQYADKRQKQYLEKKKGNIVMPITSSSSDVTFVTAIDPYYCDILKVTFPNWIKYKQLDKHPVLVFVNGIDLNDPKLDFLKLPNVQLVKWDETCMDKVDSHRELMLSAFVFGCADHVKTDYWVKLDSDSYATNSKPLVTENMKNYSIFSHRWGYSRPAHIQALDAWAPSCWHKKIKSSKPMIEEGKIEGNRFYHNHKRFISYICFQKTRFTRYCVKLLGGKRRLPCPSQDTFAYYCIQRLKPEAMGIGNFKRDHGFNQAKGKLGADHLRKCVEEVDRTNEVKAN